MLEGEEITYDTGFITIAVAIYPPQLLFFKRACSNRYP